MSDSELPGNHALVTCMVGGKSWDISEVGTPFHQDVVPALERLGFTNENGPAVEALYPDLPPFPPDREPRATFLIDGALIGLGFYLVKTLAEPTISGLGEQIYKQIVQPALDRLWSKMRNDKSQRPVVVQLDHWFDGSKVLVRVVVRCAKDDPAPDLDVVVRSALRSAAQWLQGNPVTHRVLSYEVQDGQIPSVPKLTERIESA
jgi:hypothetical protein